MPGERSNTVPMIDLHSHILPGIDDGAADIGTAVAMAEMAVEDGIRIMACTPHIVPGLYENNSNQIRKQVDLLKYELERRGIDLKLTYGADVHIAPDLAEKLGNTIPTIGGTRYFLFEPTHHILPPRLVELAKSMIERGFVPILTHPERLSWITGHYEVIKVLNDAGCLMQVTAGSLLGAFGKTSQRYAERMLEEGRVDLLASDAHNLYTRPPRLAQARDWVAHRYGDDMARALVTDRPYSILKNRELPVKAGKSQLARIDNPVQEKAGLLSRLLKQRAKW